MESRCEQHKGNRGELSVCVCVFVLHEFSAGPNERAVISDGGKRAAELKRVELKAAVFL